MKGATNKVDSRMQEANTSYNQAVAAGGSGDPIVITSPSKRGSNSSGIAANPGPTRKPPELPEECAASFAADYTYNVNLGGIDGRLKV